MPLPLYEEQFKEYVEELLSSLEDLRDEFTEEIEEDENVVEQVSLVQAQQMFANAAIDAKNAFMEFMSGSAIKTEQDRKAVVDSLPKDIFEDGVELTPKITKFIFDSIGSVFSGLMGMLNSVIDEAGADITRNIPKAEVAFKELLRGVESQQSSITKFLDKLNHNIIPNLKNVPFKILADSKIRSKLENTMFLRHAVDTMRGNPLLQKAVLVAGSRHLGNFCDDLLSQLDVAEEHLANTINLHSSILTDGIHDFIGGKAQLDKLAAGMEDTSVSALLLEGPLKNRRVFNTSVKNNLIAKITDTIAGVKGDKKLVNLVKALEYSIDFKDDLERAFKRHGNSVSGAKNNSSFDLGIDDTALHNAAMSLMESISAIKDGSTWIKGMLGEMGKESQFFSKVPAVRPILEKIYSFKYQAEKLELLKPDEYTPDATTKAAFSAFADGLGHIGDSVVNGITTDFKLLDEYFNRAARRENRGGEVISNNFTTVANRLQGALQIARGITVANKNLANGFKKANRVSSKVEKQLNSMISVGLDRSLNKALKNFSFMGEALKQTARGSLSKTLAKALGKIKADISYKLPKNPKNPGGDKVPNPPAPTPPGDDKKLVIDPEIISKVQTMAALVDSIEQNFTTLGKSFISLEAQVKGEVGVGRVVKLVPVVKLLTIGRSIIKQLSKKDKGKPSSNKSGPNPGYS